MLRLALAGPSKTATTPVCRRCFSTSETVQAPPEFGRRQGGGRRRPRGMLPPFHTWIASREADVYRHPAPGTGPNWIGDTVSVAEENRSNQLTTVAAFPFESFVQSAAANHQPTPGPDVEVAQ